MGDLPENELFFIGCAHARRKKLIFTFACARGPKGKITKVQALADYIFEGVGTPIDFETRIQAKFVY